MKYPQLVSMPSAVSDWLEEQLDARGIDAVVYTRYVLSLLQHHHSQDEDLGELEHEFRQQHAKKCGIESLVDELCEKLKHFESNTESNESKPPASNSPKRTISPTDLARKYYAAFPPLNYNNNNNNNNNNKSTCSKLITLIPQICTQNTVVAAATNNNSIQKRKHNRRPAQSHNHSNSSFNRSVGRDKTRKTDLETMKSRSGGKQRLFLTNRTTKRDFGFARNMEKTSDTSDWDVYFLNNRMGDEGYSTSDTTGVDDAEDANDMETNTFRNKKIDEAHLAKLVAKFDQRIEALWSTEENEQNEENEYHDLPVDIQDLLASPTKQNVEILNVANKRVSEKSAKSFIQCGTNITSSIWTECPENDDERSMYDSMSFSNLYNEQIESYPEKMLGDQFNCLSVAAENNDIYSLDKFRVAENETNLQFERFESSETNSFFSKFGAVKNNFTSLPWEVAFPSNFNNKKWSDAENFNFGEKFQSPLVENNNLNRNMNRAVNDSLITLNHNKEASCFKEVVPKQVLGLSSFEPQNEATTKTTQNIHVADEEPKQDGGQNKEEEDLLTSTRTHFRPIKQESHDTSSNHSGHHYADGTTFAIRSSLEHINYRRSESGTLYLESGFDTPKKYQEYRMKDVNDQVNRCDTDTESCYSIDEREFVLKFCVKQNEKCCQTEIDNDEQQQQSDVDSASSQSHSPLEVPAKKRVLCDPEEFFFPGDEELLSDTVDGAECSCASRSRVKLATSLEPLFNASTEACSLHGRDSTVAEINWPEGSWRKCDKCNNNWSSVWPLKPNDDNNQRHLNPATLWGKKLDTSSAQSWQQIWSSSEELCRTCLGVPAGSGPPPGRSLEYFKLREELSEDGEQLLSDLSCLQRVYMEQLPTTEITCDLNEINANAPEQEKPQNVFVPVAPIAAISATKLFGFTANNVGMFGTVIPGNGSGSKERKRRHSSSQRSCEPIAATVARNSWTNSSCLRPELRCLFTPPLLRPVTL